MIGETVDVCMMPRMEERIPLLNPSSAGRCDTAPGIERRSSEPRYYTTGHGARDVSSDGNFAISPDSLDNATNGNIQTTYLHVISEPHNCSQRRGTREGSWPDNTGSICSPELDNVTYDTGEAVDKYVLTVTDELQDLKAPVVISVGVVVACLVSILISMGFGYGLSVLYATLIREFSEQRSIVALNQSLYEAFLAVGGTLWTFPVSRYGYGRCLAATAFCGCVSLGLSSLAPSVVMVIVLVGCVTGATFGLAYCVPFVIAGDLFPRHKSFVIGFVSIGSSLGQFTMSNLFEFLIEEYGWRGALLILSAVCLNTIPCGLIMHIAERIHDTYERHKPTEVQDGKSLFKKKLFNQPLFILLLMNSLLLAFSALAESRFLVDLAILKGFDRSSGSLLISIIGVSNLIGGLMGAASKFCGSLSSSGHMVYLGLFIALGHGLVVYVTTFGGFVVAAIVNGLCIGNIYAHIAVALLELYGPNDYPAAFATWNLLKGVGNFFGGYLGGTIQDLTHSYDLLFFISIGMSIFYALSFLGIYVKLKITERQ